jgi:hypothetical protein
MREPRVACVPGLSDWPSTAPRPMCNHTNLNCETHLLIIGCADTVSVTITIPLPQEEQREMGSRPLTFVGPPNVCARRAAVGLFK